MKSSTPTFDRTARVGALCEKSWGVLFLEKVPPSAFNWMTSAEDSPFQKTRLFGLENTPVFNILCNCNKKRTMIL